MILKMKIALLGYGKMGKVVEKIALDRGHEIVFKKTSSNTFDGIQAADVSIEFSVPNAAVSNISNSLNAGIPIVSGTTGWLADYHTMEKLCIENNTAFIYGSNFSLGVNLFFELNDHLAKIMNKFDSYKISMKEIHHTQKLDMPSGTAISLANSIISNSNYDHWTMKAPKANELFIDAKRVEGVPGTHTVIYQSDVDSIEIKHTAHSRDGFGLGAILAAEWLVGKKGIFTMKDVLEI